MADEITYQYPTGHTLTYGVYTPAGVVRTAAGTALPETTGTGYYHATNASVVIGDQVVVKEGTIVVAGGEYRPGVDETTIVATMATILNVFDERKK